jgi:hypothetical protein
MEEDHDMLALMGTGGAGSQTQRVAASLAAHNIKIWEKTLSFRISLQKIVDTANKLKNIQGVEIQEDVLDGVATVTDNGDAVVVTKEKLVHLVTQLHDLLEAQIRPKAAGKKRKTFDGDDLDATWNNICSLQDDLQPRWEETLNKWHSRLNFGSFDATSKMKTFKQTLWQQVDQSVPSLLRLFSSFLSDRCSTRRQKPSD